MGGALTLNGTNQYVDAGVSLGTGAVTVSGWIYPNTDGGSGFSTFFREVNGGGTTRFLCSRSHSSGDKMYCGDNRSTTTNTSSVIPLKQWTHFAAVRTSGGLFTLYINGVQDGAANQNGGAASSDGTTIYIGSTGAADYLNGTLDDVRIYNRARSDIEIRDLYDATSN